jgi:hypothetical protein
MQTAQHMVHALSTHIRPALAQVDMQREDAMDCEARIKELEAALLESMLGAAALVTCVVQSLGEDDPSLQARFASNLRRWHGRASNRA